MKFPLDSVWNIFASCKVPVSGYSVEYLPQQARSTPNSKSRTSNSVILCCPWRHSVGENVFSSRGKAEIERGRNFETL